MWFYFFICGLNIDKTRMSIHTIFCLANTIVKARTTKYKTLTGWPNNRQQESHFQLLSLPLNSDICRFLLPQAAFLDMVASTRVSQGKFHRQQERKETYVPPTIFSKCSMWRAFSKLHSPLWEKLVRQYNQ